MFFAFIVELNCFHPSPVCFAVVTLVYLELFLRSGAAPICDQEQAGCHLSFLADLFDRVIQQSSRLHGISSDLHSEFVSRFFFFLLTLTSLIHQHPSHLDFYSSILSRPLH